MNRLTVPLLLGVTAALSVPGCGSIVQCNLMAYDSLEITVTDATTGATICAATVTARDGKFVEALTCETVAPCVCHGVPDRPGTYSVTADKPGYTSATVSVTAGRNACGVEPAHATIVLTPQ